MTHRERFYRILAGEQPDRIPVFANLDFWYRARQIDNDWPQGIVDHSLESIMLNLGMGITRGASVYSMSYAPPAEYQHRREGLVSIEEWHLPKGVLRRVRTSEPRQQALGMNSHLKEYPIKSAQDLHIFIDLMQHIRFEADPGFQKYYAAERSVGENGVVTVGLGKSPAHDMIMKWTGYENAYIFMVEEPELFEQAIQAAEAAYRPSWKIVADAPCSIVLHGGNYSAMTPPPLFVRWLLPGLKEFNRLMHDAGKQVLAHTDGDMSGLLEFFQEGGFDGTNCHASEPMVSCSLEDCFNVWEDKITIWGGMPCVMLEPHVSNSDFKAHLRKLANLAERGMPLIVGVSDHTMPEARYSRISDMCHFF